MAAAFSRTQVEVRAGWRRPNPAGLAGEASCSHSLFPPRNSCSTSSPCFRYRGGVYSQQTGASFFDPSFPCRAPASASMRSVRFVGNIYVFQEEHLLRSRTLCASLVATGFLLSAPISGACQDHFLSCFSWQLFPHWWEDPSVW